MNKLLILSFVFVSLLCKAQSGVRHNPRNSYIYGDTLRILSGARIGYVAACADDSGTLVWAAPGLGADLWTQNGNSLYPTGLSRIGIGTHYPQTNLHVNGTSAFVYQPGSAQNIINGFRFADDVVFMAAVDSGSGIVHTLHLYPSGGFNQVMTCSNGDDFTLQNIVVNRDSSVNTGCIYHRRDGINFWGGVFKDNISEGNVENSINDGTRDILTWQMFCPLNGHSPFFQQTLWDSASNIPRTLFWRSTNDNTYISRSNTDSLTFGAGPLSGIRANLTITDAQTIFRQGINAVLNGGPAGTILTNDGSGNASWQTISTPNHVPVRIIRSAGYVAVSSSDYLIAVNKTVNVGTAVILPSNPRIGDSYIIKDAKGDAQINNITVSPASGTIDGAGTFVISSNYGSVRVVFNGTEWSII
jgi:hypothetical protein